MLIVVASSAATASSPARYVGRVVVRMSETAPTWPPGVVPRVVLPQEALMLNVIGAPSASPVGVTPEARVNEPASRPLTSVSPAMDTSNWPLGRTVTVAPASSASCSASWSRWSRR